MSTIYRSITNGTAWRFIKLEGQTLTIDLNDYPVSPVEVLLGMLLDGAGRLSKNVQKIGRIYKTRESAIAILINKSISCIAYELEFTWRPLVNCPQIHVKG
jgi:hypothetical protein